MSYRGRELRGIVAGRSQDSATRSSRMHCITNMARKAGHALRLRWCILTDIVSSLWLIWLSTLASIAKRAECFEQRLPRVCMILRAEYLSRHKSRCRALCELSSVLSACMVGLGFAGYFFSTKRREGEKQIGRFLERQSVVGRHSIPAPPVKFTAQWGVQ